MEMNYEQFIGDYKLRRGYWQQISRWIFLFLLVSIIGVSYLFWPTELLYSYVEGRLERVLMSIAAIVCLLLVTLLFIEAVLNLVERVLEKSYLKPYVIVSEDTTILVYGFIRDADRTTFQLKLQRMYPGYEMDVGLAAQSRCSFALTKIE